MQHELQCLVEGVVSTMPEDQSVAAEFARPPAHHVTKGYQAIGGVRSLFRFCHLFSSSGVGVR